MNSSDSCELATPSDRSMRLSETSRCAILGKEFFQIAPQPICSPGLVMYGFWRTLRLPALLIAAMVALGCQPSVETPEPNVAKEAAPLRILLVDETSLDEVLQREWSARFDTPLSIEHVTAADLSQAKRLGTDVVIFPTMMLGSLAEADLIAPLPTDEVESQARDVREQFANVRAETRWEGQTFGVSLGSTRWLLAYRSDLLAQAGIEPPQTWAQLNEACQRLADRSQFADLPIAKEKWHALLQPTAPQYGGHWMLARAASKLAAGSQISPLLDYDTLEPRLTSPAIVDALSALVSDATSAGQTDELSPSLCWQKIVAGECAMAIAFPERLDEAALDATPKTIRETIRFVPLPSSEEGSTIAFGGFSGRIVSVASASDQPQLAATFLWWLTSSEIASRIAPACADTCPTSPQQLEQLSSWTGELAGAPLESAKEALKQTLEASEQLIPLRVPGYQLYAEALDKAVRDTLSKKSDAQKALEAASAEWKGTTVAKGSDGQRQAYHRSLK